MVSFGNASARHWREFRYSESEGSCMPATFTTGYITTREELTEASNGVLIDRQRRD